MQTEGWAGGWWCRSVSVDKKRFRVHTCTCRSIYADYACVMRTVRLAHGPRGGQRLLSGEPPRPGANRPGQPLPERLQRRQAASAAPRAPAGCP
jgi:hypothetical protein